MANDTLSINKIVSIFRDLALRNKMVTDFGYGPTYNIGASRQMKFPYVWVEQNSTSTNKSDNGYKEAYITFTIFCMDKISMGDDNYDEIISDTHYILDTMIQEIAQHKFYVDMNLSIDGDINFDPVVEGTDDNVNGWQCDITLKMPIRYTPCNSPIEPISGYTTQLNSSIVEYRLQGTSGTSGSSGINGTSGTSGLTGTSGTSGVDGATYTYITEDTVAHTLTSTINEIDGIINSTVVGDAGYSGLDISQSLVHLSSRDIDDQPYTNVNITPNGTGIGSVDLVGNDGSLNIQPSNITGVINHDTPTISLEANNFITTSKIVAVADSSSISSTYLDDSSYSEIVSGVSNAYIEVVDGTDTSNIVVNGASISILTPSLLIQDASISGYTIPTTDGTTGDVLTTDGAGVATWQPQPKNGLFAQILDGTPVSGTITETNMIGVGVGTLSVPANGFVVGDSFTAFLDGRISCINTATLHIHIRTLGGVLLADTDIITLQTSTNKNWKLDIQFTIRSLGGPGVASISSGGLFGYVRNSGSNYEGSVLSTINNTTFDTTIDNTLIITAQWNTTNAGNSILCRNFTLTKTY